MAHLGRHSADPAVWEGMVRSYVALIGELSRAWNGWEPREIDLGGGFASPRDPTGRATEYGSARRHAPSVEEYAEVLTGALRRELLGQGLTPAGKTLEIEPGRGLFADTGLHLATVRHVKVQDEPLPWRWVETDTTEMFLLDTLVEHCRWTVYVADKADRPSVQVADIVGLSCGFDVIVSQAQLPDVEPGDVIAFLDTGAYQDACSANFNALPRPATVLVGGERAEVIKRAETVDEVFRRDVIPPRLRGHATVPAAAVEAVR
jgi:diaminopimelate decarboxylase